MADAPRVTKVIKKTKEIRKKIEDDLDEMPDLKRPNDILSANKVAGWSLNFPIQGTCKPSKLCIKTCYYAAGMTAWTNSLRKQMWNYQACVNDPIWFAEEVVKEYRKRSLTYLRWNGGGDLFNGSVDALNHIGENHPDVVIWIVTRIPEMAAKVGNYPNLHLHFSLDKESMVRKLKMNEMDFPMKDRIFFSYQCDKDEYPDMDYLIKAHGVSLFFFDNYKVPPLLYHELKSKADVKYDSLCPLNIRKANEESIEGTCGECRRCFDGTNVKNPWQVIG
tara:strand:+ start:292 stop:1122 length:831 start_codon:yes stop_codon:yes gene_type:complete